MSDQIDPEMMERIEHILVLARYIEEVKATQRQFGRSDALEKQEADLVVDLYRVLTNTHTATESLIPEDDTLE